MSRGTTRRLLTTLAAALIALGAGTPATASGTVSGVPRGALALLLWQPDTGRFLGAATLTCRPDGGTHPRSRAVCSAVRAVDGDLTRLPSDPAASCVLIHQPVRAEARGYWNHRAVHYTRTFPNRCVAAVDTAYLFAF